MPLRGSGAFTIRGLFDRGPCHGRPCLRWYDVAAGERRWICVVVPTFPPLLIRSFSGYGVKSRIVHRRQDGQRCTMQDLTLISLGTISVAEIVA